MERAQGITEAGSTASWTAVGTSYATHGEPMIPLYIFYSMFGFQRTGDGLWAAADQMTRGFLLGATAGRTTLNGEGLQHQDGQSLLIASTNPACLAYDAAYAYELGHIVRDAAPPLPYRWSFNRSTRDPGADGEWSSGIRHAPQGIRNLRPNPRRRRGMSSRFFARLATPSQQYGPRLGSWHGGRVGTRRRPEPFPRAPRVRGAGTGQGHGATVSRRTTAHLLKGRGRRTPCSRPISTRQYVTKCLEHIAMGDIYQVQIGHELRVENDVPPG